MMKQPEMAPKDFEGSEVGGSSKPLPAREFWEKYRLDSIGRTGPANEDPHEAMERISRETNEASARRAESIRKITDGIKARLKDWRKEDLYKLDSHIGDMVDLNSTFDESLGQLVEKCEEGTETGKVWRNESGRETRISRNPHVAPRPLIERLPWVINHDDSSLGVQAGKIISLGELRDLVKEVLKG